MKQKGDSLINNAQKLQKNKKIIRLGGYTSLPYGILELKYDDGGITTNEV